MSDDTKLNPTRRTLIKGAVAAGGVLGFPYVHAQEKITLRYLGTAVKYAVFKSIVRSKRRQELLQEQTPLRADTDPTTEEQLDARFLKDFLEGVVEKLPEKAKLVFNNELATGL